MSLNTSAFIDLWRKEIDEGLTNPFSSPQLLQIQCPDEQVGGSYDSVSKETELLPLPRWQTQTVQQLAGGTFKFLPCQVLPFLGIPGGGAAVLLRGFGSGANAVRGRVRLVVGYLSTSHACFDSSKTRPAAEVQSPYRAALPSALHPLPKKGDETPPPPPPLGGGGAPGENPGDTDSGRVY